jgi:repressor LexA
MFSYRRRLSMSKEREQRILEYMKQQIAEKGYPPTVREICAALNIKSTSTAHKDIDNLVKDGFIKKDPSKPRALMIVDKGDGNGSVTKTSKASTKSEGAAEANISSNEYGDVGGNVVQSEVVEIPVVGRIAAGTPILAEENIEDSFPIPARFADRGNHFMLTVRGESMIEAGIMDGDYILVQQQNTARDGDIVVAMVDGFESEATVKTFYKEKGHLRLQPENSTMSPIIVNDVRILGKVTGVFRYF